VYGHAGGFEDMFRALDQARQGQKLPPALLSTHPRIEARIAHLKKLAQRNGWAVSGKLTPLRLKPEVSR
jgi:Zn-dependent protease with chaperone function